MIDNEIEARLELWRDFEKYSKYALKIQTEDGKLVPFEFNEIQKVLRDIFKDIRKNGRLIRVVILKARREGVSTFTTGRFYWKTTTNKNRYAMIITHDPESKDFLFNMVKRYHNFCPQELKPEDKYNNKAILEFNNANGTGLDSAIRVGCAGKDDLGSGMKIDFLHFSEYSKWDKNVIEALTTSTFQTVPNDPSTEIIIESTAKGVGGAFYDKFWNARYRYEVKLNEKDEPYFICEVNKDANEDNEFSSIFIPCYVFKKYRMPVKENFIPTEEELELKRKYGVNDEFLQWRRWTISNKCNNSIDIFYQEYPTNPYEAFISSSISVFPTKLVVEAMEYCKEPKKKYEINLSLLDMYERPDGRFLVWKEPQYNGRYIVSADVSEGLEGDKKDFSSIDVIDWITGEQVAHWHGKISPDLLGCVIYSIAKKYNNAYVVPEKNNHGLVVINKLLDLGYTNIHVEIQYEPPHKPRKRYGWVTSKSTKPAVIDNLIAELRDGILKVNCKDTLKEMMTFKQNEDGTLEAEEGHKDDRVMSLAIGKYIRTILPLPKNSPKVKDITYGKKGLTVKTPSKGMNPKIWS